MSDDKKLNKERRKVLKAGAVGAGALGMAGLMTGFSSQVFAAGSDKPEKTQVNVGFIPLTDCASVVVASQMGFDRKYGIEIVPSKEASWAAVRDKLINGELDASHVLYGLIYGVQLGIGGPKKDMAVLMNLNHNGQAITLAKQLLDAGVKDGETLKKAIASKSREYTFAHTFPTGTHAMWLYYWLAAHDIHPLKDVKTITVPPPQMVANMRVGNMDGYCVGEPWNARAVFDKIGFTATTTQDIWTDHPEKVLGCTADFVKKYPNTTRALIAAVLDAARYIDETKNRAAVAKLIAGKAYVNAPEEVILGRFLGDYDNGAGPSNGGKVWKDPNYMKFFNDGAVNYPYLSDGMWFLTQHKRWGLLSADVDYLAVAKQINQIEFYKQAALMASVKLPGSDMRSSKFMDGKVWDGKDPKAYAASFAVHA